MGAITFLMGMDSAGNAFFANAKGFFTGPNSVVIDAPAGGQSLEGVFKVLRDRANQTPKQVFDPINIVAHATGFSSLQFRMRAAATSPDIITADDLTAEIAKINAKAADAWKQLGQPIIISATKVVLYGCDVGRGAPFVRDFGRLFGEDLHVYAPLRVAVFRHAGTTFEHRLARTWSVPWPSAISQATAWPPTRTKFVADAVTKFGPTWTAVTNDPLGPIGLENNLKNVAVAATEKQAASWFFHEQISFDPSFVTATMPPVRSAIVSPGGSDVDDTTVENSIGPSHVTDRTNAATWVAHLLVLAQIIEQSVDITSSAQYRHVDIDPPQDASPGPKPPPNAPPITPPAHTSVWDEARDALIAAGVGETEIDSLSAGLAQADPGSLALADPDVPSVAGIDAEPTAEDFA